MLLMYTLLSLAQAMDLSPSDQAALAAGEPVARAHRTEAGVSVAEGAIHIQAEPERIVAAVLDMNGRVADSGLLTEVEVYDTGPNVRAATFRGGALGKTFVYSVRYTCQALTCSYDLDPGHPTDLLELRGSYTITPVEGGLRLTIHSESKSDAMVPGWILDKIRAKSTRDLLEALKRRAG